MSCDEDPLDLLEDDGDGVIEVILMEEEEKPIRQRTGCGLIVAGAGLSALLAGWLVRAWLA